MHIRLHFLAAACTACVAASALAQQPIPVGTTIAAKQPVRRAVDFVGRIEAVDKVDVHARVSGYLEDVLFTEGTAVQAGDKLFQIDSAPFEAAVQQARGALLQAQGSFANASVQLQRAEELVKSSATSVAVRDQRQADQTNAQGAVVRADADLKTAQINLSYATITSPIAGRIGRAQVTKGNLVGPDSGTLALIVSQDPMFVVFPVSQREFLRIRQEGGKADRDSVRVELRFADGSLYDQTGAIDFVDVAVNQGTDTVVVRARVPNPASVLVPGQFVRVAVVGKAPEERVVVPQAAILADQEGTYVFVVQDGKAVVRRVKPGAEVGAGMAMDGVQAGDAVVVNGTQSLRPGAAVAATPVPDALGAVNGKPAG